MQVSRIDLKCSNDVSGVNCSSLDTGRPKMKEMRWMIRKGFMFVTNDQLAGS